MSVVEIPQCIICCENVSAAQYPPPCCYTHEACGKVFHKRCMEKWEEVKIHGSAASIAAAAALYYNEDEDDPERKHKFLSCPNCRGPLTDFHSRIPTAKNIQFIEEKIKLVNLQQDWKIASHGPPGILLEKLKVGGLKNNMRCSLVIKQIARPMERRKITPAEVIEEAAIVVEMDKLTAVMEDAEVRYEAAVKFCFLALLRKTLLHHHIIETYGVIKRP